MSVLSDDFAAVDVREELCYHSRPKKQIQEVHGTGIKPMKESHARRQKRQPIPKAVQRGRLRAAALSVWFSALFLLPFRGVCLAAARISAAHLSITSTRHGAKACFVQHMETAAILIVCRLIVIE